ncbi:MAG TPA: DUF1294 domain-containing protein [Clostridiaceae bacterium]|nr:DUF1294 domain-containing protein [Clostridiaceae bacterium]
MRTILGIFLIINLAAFIVVGIDKYKAKRSLWRIPERVFFWFALIGGCPGIYSGLMLFRHKTRHWYFVYGIPFIFLFQIVIVYLALNI